MIGNISGKSTQIFEPFELHSAESGEIRKLRNHYEVYDALGAILSKAHNLGCQGKELQIQTCLEMCSLIFAVQKYINDELKCYTLQREAACRKIENAERQYALLTTRTDRAKQEISNLCASMAGLNARKKSLFSDLRQLRLSIESHEKEAKNQESVRSEMIGDSIPILGQLAAVQGAVESGRIYRVIPFASLFVGIFSHATHDYERTVQEKKAKLKEYESLQEELANTNNSIKRNEELIENTQNELNENAKERTEIDQRVRELGNKITDLSNLKSVIDGLKVKFIFINLDVDVIRDFLGSEIEKSLIRDFILSIERTRAAFRLSMGNLSQLTNGCALI